MGDESRFHLGYPFIFAQFPEVLVEEINGLESA
jgi:hypothetical protein